MRVLTYLAMLVISVLLPCAMYALGVETYHFCTCDRKTTGEVLSVAYEGRKSLHTITFSYTSAEGEKLSGTQTVDHHEAALLYPVSSALKLRCKQGHAFIDNGQENKLWNIAKISIIFIFWCIPALMLAGALLDLRNALRNKPAR